jgi:uncharacterized membrane protein YbaN (DUF454 family)
MKRWAAACWEKTSSTHRHRLQRRGLWLGEFELNRTSGITAKVLIVVAALIGVGFIIAAVVTYVRVGDWPARYLYAAALILLFVVIALKRLGRRNQAQ